MEPDLRARVSPISVMDLAATRVTTQVRVANHSRWGATNVEISYHAADGRTAAHTYASIGPVRGSTYDELGGPQEVSFEVGKPTMPTDDPDWRGDVTREDRLVIEFSDERGLLRWQKLIRYVNTYRRDDRTSGGSSGEYATVTRIR